MNTLVQRFKWQITMVIGLVLIAGTWLLGRPPATPEATPIPLLAVDQATDEVISLATTAPTPTIVAPTATPNTIAVYVSGAVRKPGVYRLAEGSRVDDAVKLAGGMTDDADQARINLAAKVRDEQQIYVLKIDEVPPVGVANTLPANPANSTTASPQNSKVNINTASIAELDTLPRIGPATAQRIIDYRTANGLFKTIEDLQNVKGIGAATFADLKDRITVDP